MDEHEARRLADAARVYRATLGGPDEPVHAAPLRDAADSLVSAITQLVELSDVDAALTMCADLSAFWQDAGLIDAGRAAIDTALAAGGSAEPRARGFLTASELAFRQGDQEATVQLAREAIRLATETGATTVAGKAHINLARMSFRADDADGLARHLDDAEAVADRDPSVTKGVLHLRAWEAYVRGDTAEARRRFDMSIDFARSQGDRFTEAAEQAHIADLDLEVGDVAAATRRLGHALQVADETHSAYLLLSLGTSIARVAVERHRYADAVTMLGAVDAGYRAAGLIGDPTQVQDAKDVEHRIRGEMVPAEIDAARARGHGMGLVEMPSFMRGVLRSTN